ncbi:MAG: ABC transporter permease [Lentimicrobiaceae bacterium]
MKHRTFYLISHFLGALILLFIAAPIIGMITKTGYQDVFETAQDKEVLNSIWLSVSASLIATIVFSMLSMPFAWLLARRKFFFKRFILGLIDLPIIIPHTAAGIALLGIVSRNSALGKMAASIGLDFVGHPAGIVIAMAFVSLPFFLNSAREGFSQVPDRLEKAALNLGVNPFRVFLTVSIPLASRHIVTGAVMMFARGISEFGAVVIIAYYPMTASVLIFERFSSFGLQYARPAAVILIIVTISLFLLMRLFSKDPENARN